MPRKPKPKPAYPTVHARELSTIAMTCGNEKKFPKVVDDREVKQWVGFGWVSEGLEQSPRDDKLPRVVRD
jgi:hypothetical protein